MQDFLQVAMAASGGLDTWSLLKNASLVVKGVMIVLALMSIFGWYIIGYKVLYVRRASSETEKFVDSFWRSRDIDMIYKNAQALSHSPVSQMFLAGYTELAKITGDGQGGASGDLENVRRALRKAQGTETTKLESMISFLATTGSAAPFIGLFGTVWGIMNSFKEIGAMKSASIAVVAPRHRRSAYRDRDRIGRGDSGCHGVQLLCQAHSGACLRNGHIRAGLPQHHSPALLEVGTSWE